MKLLISKKFKLRNKTFLWIGRVKKTQKDSKKYVESFGTVGETQKPYETDEKIEMAKQDTTKTSFLALSGSKISILVTGIVPKTEGDYDVNN